MTKVLCDLTGCKHNSSCCTCPSGSGHYCTKEEINLIIDPEICQMDCNNFEEDYEKEVECRNCQIDKYGGIKLATHLDFEIKKGNEQN